jgi:hypothetical protein
MQCNKFTLFLVLHFLFFPYNVFAYNATSSNFLIRQNVQSISGGAPNSSRSTSTSFLQVGAGGQGGVGIGTSTSFTNFSGILQNLFKSFKPDYTQVHYHFRNNDGNETGATSGTGGVQDTATSSIAKNTGKRLRIEIANEGGTQASYTTQQFRIEYGLKVTTCSAISSWVDVGSVSGDWDMFDSQYLTDGGNTTNISVSSGGVTDENNSFVGTGAIKDTGSQTSALSLSSLSFIELEYSIQALSGATDGGTYCFRVTNAGSSSLFTYSVYPEATIASASQSITFTISDNSIGFGTLSASAARYATGDATGASSEGEAHTIVVGTNASNGYTLTVNGSTLTSGAYTISAIGSSNTSSSAGSEQFGLRMTASGGSGSVSAPYAASGFAFDTAAFPDEVAASTGASTNTTYSARYLANIASNTEAGSYTATLTYVATPNF